MDSYSYDKNSRQKGSAIVETVIVLPFLLVVSLCLYDYGKYLETYWTLENAAREGIANMIRLGSMRDGSNLGSGGYNLDVTKNQFENCFSQWSDGTASCKHMIVHWIVNNVANSQERWDNPNDFVVITSAYDDYRYLEINTKYTPTIDIFNKLSLDIRITEISYEMDIRY